MVWKVLKYCSSKLVSPLLQTSHKFLKYFSNFTVLGAECMGTCGSQGQERFPRYPVQRRQCDCYSYSSSMLLMLPSIKSYKWVIYKRTPISVSVSQFLIISGLLQYKSGCYSALLIAGLDFSFLRSAKSVTTVLLLSSFQNVTVLSFPNILFLGGGICF